MSICKNCSFEVRSNGKFCPKCGTPIEQDTAVKSEEQHKDISKTNTAVQDNSNRNTVVQDNSSPNINTKGSSQQNTNVEEKPIVTKKKTDSIKFKASFEKLSKNVKKVFVKIPKLYLQITLIVVVIIAIAIGSGSYIFSKDRALRKFKEAMTSHKSNEIIKMLVQNSSKMEINETTIQPLIKYMDKNPQWLNVVLDSLKQQSDEMNDKTAKLSQGSNASSSPDIVFINKGKRLLFFNQYAFEIKPYFINLNMKLKNSKVSLNNGTPIISDRDNYSTKLGPFIPGVYQLKSSLEEKYINIKKDMEIELIGGDGKSGVPQNSIDVSINFEEAVFIQLSSDYDKAKIYLDGKDTGVLVKDANRFGPVSSTSKIYAESIVGGQVVKSSEELVGNRDSILLRFPSTTETEVDTDPKPPAVLNFDKIAASSVLDEVNYNHEPKLVSDGDKNTAWVEGSPDEGIGQWIKLESDSIQSVSGINIINGYAKNSKSYYANNRAAQIRIDFSNGKILIYDLQDGIMNTQQLNFGEVIQTQFIKVTILQVYRGSTYNDTCISEINVY